MAKRRRLENLWIAWHFEADYVAYRQCCSTTNVINELHRNHTQQQLNNNTSSAAKMWKISKELLHSANRDEARTDEENQRLCNTSDFFATKITTIKTTISARLTSLNYPYPAPYVMHQLPTFIFPIMYSCKSTNITCCLLLQIIPTRLHSNFPPRNLLFRLFRTYLHSRQSFYVSRHFSLLLQSRPNLTTLKESRQRYPIKLQTNQQSQQHLQTSWTSYTTSYPRSHYLIFQLPCLLDYLHVTTHDYNMSRMPQHVSLVAYQSLSIQPVLIDVLHWLLVAERITFKMALLTYKALHGLTPSYLTDKLVPVTSNPALRQNWSADRGDLVVPRIKNISYVNHSFSIAASRLWNTLPCELRSSSSATTFPTNLKTYLFRTAYNINASNYWVWWLFCCEVPRGVSIRWALYKFNNNNFNPYRSTYRRFNSTETACY